MPYKVMMKVRTGVDPSFPGKPCFGSNGILEGSGVFRIGDLVTVREWVS